MDLQQSACRSCGGALPAPRVRQAGEEPGAVQPGRDAAPATGRAAVCEPCFEAVMRWAAVTAPAILLGDTGHIRWAVPINRPVHFAQGGAA